jgi:hypothetical protein
MRTSARAMKVDGEPAKEEEEEEASWTWMDTGNSVEGGAVKEVAREDAEAASPSPAPSATR